MTGPGRPGSGSMPAPDRSIPEAITPRATPSDHPPEDEVLPQMISAETLSSDLAHVFLRMHRLCDRRMTAVGASLARTKLLLYLESQIGEARASDIAEFFGLAPRTVTDALDALERDGMVRRELDPRDRRVKRLWITDAGVAAIAATEPLRLAMTDQIFGVLDAAEREQFQAMLVKLAAAIGAQEAGKAP